MTSILFDTSVLVASFISSHPKHSQAISWLKRARKKELTWYVSTHSLAELYAVLTRLPISPKVSSLQAQLLLEKNILDSAKIVALTTEDYLQVIKQVAELGLVGGIIYDAVMLKAAQKVKAQKILTFNLRDFQRLTPENPNCIISP